MALDECRAQLLRVKGIIIEFILEPGKQLVKGGDEFLSIPFGDLRKIADHPALVFEFPFVRQTNETIIGCNIGEEGELPATQRAVLSLAAGGSQTGQEDHGLGRIRFQRSALCG